MNGTFKHSVKSSTHEAIAMTVTYSGHQKCSADHRWGKGVREQYILHLIVSGKGTYITPYGEHRLTAGDIFLIRPFTEIEYFSDENEPWEYLWVNFTGEDSEYILNRTDLTPENPVIHNCSDEIYSAMENIISNPAGKRYEKVELTGQLYILLSLLMKSSAAAIKSDKKSETAVLKSAKSYVAANYPMPITVEDIASAAGVSRATLFRIFKSEMGVSPVNYLTSFRISQAKKLLSQTELSVTAVAKSVGYEDNLYFSRVFSKSERISPKEYRNLQQKSI